MHKIGSLLAAPFAGFSNTNFCYFFLVGLCFSSSFFAARKITPNKFIIFVVFLFMISTP